MAREYRHLYQSSLHPESPPPSSSSSATKCVDWTLCVICQEKTKDKLVCPAKGKRGGIGYSYVAEKLAEFDELGICVVPFDFSLLDDGSGIANTFAKHNASWHKKCRDGINTRMLNRAKHKLQSSGDCASPAKTRKSTAPHDVKCCLFCGGPASSDRLHKASTKEIDIKVRQCASILNDQDIVKKLAGGDMVATDSLYHNKCLQKYYKRASKEARQREEKDSSDDTCHGIAFAELVSFILSFENDTVAPVFHMSNLSKMYQSRLEALGVHSAVHSTRLRQNLLAACPMLQECNTGKGQDIKLVFKQDVEGAFIKATDRDSEALLLAEVARIVRRDMFSQQYLFTGSFEEDCQRQSVPKLLGALVSMILDGPETNLRKQNQDEDATLEAGQTQAAVTIAQLLMFNSRKYGPQQNQEKQKKRHHAKNKEMPVPIYLGLKMHAETRKQEIVDCLYHLGLSISYDRVMAISTDIANSVCAKFTREGVVVPPGLTTNVFTVGMMDNIDHNPSSTTAPDSFHGTSISMVQHTSESDKKPELLAVDSTVQGTRSVQPLPNTYTLVAPLERKREVLIPAVVGLCKPEISQATATCKSQHEWLETVHTAVNFVPDVDHEIENHASDQPSTVSWGAFHASKQEKRFDGEALIALLPLLVDNAHSLALIKHVMGITKAGIEHLNPGQIPVLGMDQPLYAMAKEIQWAWPDEFGEDCFVVMLGGLHVEMSALRLAGDWLNGSGWTSLLESAGVVRGGVADSFLKASHVTRTRLAHEITAAALYILMQEAYAKNQDVEENFETWCSSQTQKQPMFAYWSQVLQLELSVLHLVHSIRTADFDKYVEALAQLMPWFFALDHVHYARWLSVHLRDLCQLLRRHPSVHQAFCRGAFVVHKTGRPFSAIALDQAHEQCNKMVKGDGGAVGLTTNPGALRRWMTAGPEIARLLISFERQTATSKSAAQDHHEHTPAVQKSFKKDVESLVSAFEETGNPFEDDSGCLFAMDTKIVADAAAIKAVENVVSTGQQQYDEFVKERLVERITPVTATLRRNKLRVFVQQKTTQKASITYLRNDCSLFSRLYIACQTRKGNLPDFFRHENQPTPPSLSKLGEIRSGKKADLLRCLEPVGCQVHPTTDNSSTEYLSDEMTPTMEEQELVDAPLDDQDILSENELIPCIESAELKEELLSACETNIVSEIPDAAPAGPPKVDAKILDGAFIVQLLSPRTSRTFQEFSDAVFMPYILSQLEGVSRLDVVWDVYLPDSLKTCTRQKRGHGQRRMVSASAPIPSNWKGFLRNNSNKEDLFSFLAEELKRTDIPGKILISTNKTSAVCSSPETDLSIISGCQQEEADTRMFLHAFDCTLKGKKKIIIRTADTDVVVLAISSFRKIKAEELWIAFGTGKHFRFIPAHKIALNLPLEMTQALPMLHAITGCDTVSFFSGKGKVKAWETWMLYPEVTSAFLELISDSKALSEDCFSKIERFVVLMYEKNSTMTSVNEARQRLFSQQCRSIENIPPTSDALRQHTLRAAYQALVWSRCLEKNPVLPCPRNWGWTKQEGETVWKPLWTTLPQADHSCYELIRCGCKKGCKTRCKCVIASLQCTALCQCGGDCVQE